MQMLIMLFENPSSNIQHIHRPECRHRQTGSHGTLSHCTACSCLSLCILLSFHFTGSERKKGKEEEKTAWGGRRGRVSVSVTIVESTQRNSTEWHRNRTSNLCCGYVFICRAMQAHQQSSRNARNGVGHLRRLQHRPYEQLEVNLK